MAIIDRTARFYRDLVDRLGAKETDLLISFLEENNLLNKFLDYFEELDDELSHFYEKEEELNDIH